MSLVELLKAGNAGSLDMSRSRLLDCGCEIAYGDSYSLKEIRKAVRDGYPALVEIGDRTTLVSGETEDGLVIDHDGSLFEVPDADLLKHWTGRAIIALRKAETPERTGFVLRPVERDTWPLEGMEAMRGSSVLMRKLDDLPDRYRPSHPVVVVFRNPTETEAKDGIRSACRGAEINLLDRADPSSEFLHELGHVYWASRLTADEKARFDDLRDKIERSGTVPAIFDAPWNWHNGEELFCTLYMWKLKGLLLDRGYERILKSLCPEGASLIEDVFSRVQQNGEMEESWSANERLLSMCVRDALGEPVLASVGDRVLKARMPVHWPEKIRLPGSVERTFLGEHAGRRWVRIETGLLKGRVLVLKADDMLDSEYMKRRKRFYLVPRQIEAKGRNGVYRKTAYVRPVDSDGLADGKDEPGLLGRIFNFIIRRSG